MSAAPFIDLGPLMREVELLQASMEHYGEWGRDQAAHVLVTVQQVQAVLRSVEFSAEVHVRAAERTSGLRQERMIERLGGRPGAA